MRTLVGIALLVGALLAHGPGQADTRAACIAACESTAQTCMAAAHDKYDACKPAANKGCAATPPAEKFKCLSTALMACTTNRSSEIQPCRTSFDACYATCGPRPAGQLEFWCTLDATSVASAATLRKNAFCPGDSGQSPEEQQAACMKLHAPTDPAMGFSLECDPLG